MGRINCVQKYFHSQFLNWPNYVARIFRKIEQQPHHRGKKARVLCMYVCVQLKCILQ